MARLTVDVDAELMRRVEFATVARDETVDEFLKRAVMRELENGDGGDELYVPPKYVKPKGSENPPKLERGNTLSEAVIEDRR